MTWIQTISYEQADGALRDVYDHLNALFPPEYSVSVVPGGDGVMSAHSILPNALRDTFCMYAGLLSPDLPLSRSQHEMIATVVSAANRCFY
jgi:hypothetical protein